MLILASSSHPGWLIAAVFAIALGLAAVVYAVSFWLEYRTVRRLLLKLDRQGPESCYVCYYWLVALRKSPPKHICGYGARGLSCL